MKILSYEMMYKKKREKKTFLAPIFKRIRIFKEIEKRDNMYTGRLVKIRKSLKRIRKNQFAQ